MANYFSNLRSEVLTKAKEEAAAKLAARDAAAKIPAPVQVTPELKKTISDDLWKSVNEGALKGEEAAKKYFAPGSLGTLTNARGPEVEALLRMQLAGAQGMTTPEQQAMRASAVQGLNNQTQTGLRSLRGFQGASGVRGGAAQAGALGVLQNAAQQRAGFEREMVQHDADLRRTALDAYARSLFGAQGTELDIMKTNLGYRQREAEAGATLPLVYGQYYGTMGDRVNTQAIADAAATNATGAASQPHIFEKLRQEWLRHPSLSLR